MKLIFHIIPALLLISADTIAQKSGDLPAKVVLKDGTVLEGSIHLVSSHYTPQKFKFVKKQDGPGQYMTLIPENIISINIRDSIHYVSADLRLFTNVIETNLINNDTAQLVKEGIFFIEEAVRGDRLSLYTLADKEKDHFIIQDSTGVFNSLKFVRFIDNANGLNNIRELTFYKNQLLAYSNDQNEVQQKIISSKFELSDLVDAVTAINKSNNIGRKVSTEIKNRKIVYVFGQVELMGVRFDYSGYPQSLNAMKFSSKLFPKIALGVELHLDRKEKVFLNVFTGLYPISINNSIDEVNNTGTVFQKKLEVSGFSVILGSLVEYAFFKFNKSKLAFGIGYSLTLNKYNKNNYTSTDKNADGSTVILDQLDFGKAWTQLFFTADYFVNDRLSICAGFAPAQDFSNFTLSSFNQTQFSFGAKYRF